MFTITTWGSQNKKKYNVLHSCFHETEAKEKVEKILVVPFSEFVQMFTNFNLKFKIEKVMTAQTAR